MANTFRIQEILLKALEGLNADELKRFQWHLIQGVLDSLPPIAKAKVEGVSLDETVSQVMQFYDDTLAVKVTATALKRMNQNQLARKLDEVLREGFSHRNTGKDIVPNA